MSRYQKGKTNLDFTEARDSEWQWHQPGRMQVCTSLQTDNHASTPTTQFLQTGCPSCRQTNSVKALKVVTPDVAGNVQTIYFQKYISGVTRVLSDRRQMQRSASPPVTGAVRLRLGGGAPVRLHSSVRIPTLNEEGARSPKANAMTINSKRLLR